MKSTVIRALVDAVMSARKGEKDVPIEPLMKEIQKMMTDESVPASNRPIVLIFSNTLNAQQINFDCQGVVCGEKKIEETETA